jgi:RHS repeat-associated protein
MKITALTLKSFLFGIFLNFAMSQSAIAQSKNFVEREIIKVPMITQVTQLAGLTTTQKQTTRTYFDGMGRPVQVIAVKASPLQKDIVQPNAYDSNGDQPVSYLPYVASDGTGSYRPTAISSEQPGFYNNGTGDKVADDNFPFSKQIIENSPLRRMLQSGSVGAGFQLGEHYSSINYRSNSNVVDGAVILWLPDGSRSGSYADNVLSVTEASDPDGNRSLTYTDKAGRVLLKRAVLDATHNSDTYYIYNESGGLSYTIPPKAVKLLTDNAAYTLSTVSVASLIYRYQYDIKGRLIIKTIPTLGDLYIVYDPLQRPVLLQDANLRAANKWNFIKYDVQGRAVLQGTYTDAIRNTLSLMQSYVDGMASSYSTQWYEKRSNLPSNAYYTNTVFPTAGTTVLRAGYFDDYDLNQDGVPDYSYTSQNLSGEGTATTLTRGMQTIVRTLTIGNGLTTTIWLTKVMFYDKMGIQIQIKSNNQLVTDMNDIATSIPDFSGATIQNKVVKYHNATNATTVLSTYAYDHMYRLTSIRQKYNNVNESIVANYDYNELGKLVAKKLSPIGSGSVPATLNLNTVYNGTHDFTASESITLSDGFNAPAGSIFSAKIAGNYLQKVDYRYNIRGQLLSINNSKLTADNADPNANTNDDTNDVFGEELLYNQSNTQIGNSTKYNGFITGSKWMSVNNSNVKSNERSYKYIYDGLGRLTTANYAERTSNAAPTTSFSLNLGGFDEKGITYDESGNITTLQRNSSTVGGSGGTLIDNLNYTYDAGNPNKLLRVTDGASAVAGFRNYTGSTADYTYDNAGNLSADPNKGITPIVYNALNRVEKVTLNYSATGRFIDYSYDATGKLIRKRAFDNNLLQTTTDYIDGFQYTTLGGGSANLDFFVMPEGRVRNTGTGGTVTLKQEFIITDHQGNARVSFEDNGSGQALVKQENSYYAFGMNMTSTMALPGSPNKNLYNGLSEWQNDFANQPDWQQTFYRNYDQTIGRFLAADPMAEVNDELSVYQYSGNNPVMMNDPLGDYVKPIPGTYITNYNYGQTHSMHWMNNNSVSTMDDFQLIQAAQNGNSEAYDLYLSRNNSARESGVGLMLKPFFGDKFDYDPMTGFWSNTYNNAQADQYGNIRGEAGISRMGQFNISNQGGVTASQYLALWGAEASALENLAGKTQLGNWKLYFENPATGRVFKGNQYVKTIGLAKTGKVLGVAGGIVGMGLDGVGVYNYYNPTAENINSRVSPGKFGADGVMTGVGIWGGPFGAGASVLYFGIDAFYPGGVQGASSDYISKRLKYESGAAGMEASMMGLQ